jgi:excisionase family DNA binding protein
VEEIADDPTTPLSNRRYPEHHPTKIGALRPNERPSESLSLATESAGYPQVASGLKAPQKGAQAAPDAVSTEVTTIPPVAAALLYTIPEVMTLLRLSKTQVFDELRRGRIQSVKIGRARRVPAQCLNEFVALLIRESQEAA